MSTIDFEQALQKIEHLPSLPAVVMELLDSIDQDDTDVSILSRKVSHDQALTAKTLQLANSPLFATQVKVTTIHQAITLLGFNSVRNLITASAVAGCFPGSLCQGFSFKLFWRHSVATAVCAQVLARHLHVNQDYSFTAGLLHDIGRLVLVTSFPAEYGQALALRAQRDCFLLDAERESLGVDHVVAGQMLAQHWNFSETMLKAIAAHHEPDALGAGFLAAIVHVADFIVHGLDIAGADDDLVPPLSAVALDAMGLSEDGFMHVFRETELHFEEIGATLLI